MFLLAILIPAWASSSSALLYLLYPLLNIFHTISVLYGAHLCMKCSLGISNFLEEISSLSHSVVFLYFFALIAEEGFLISSCYWLQIGKGVCQGCILPPCLFNLYAEYIIWNAGLDESQAGIKTAGRNINNLRYADDITRIAESEEELKSLLMRVKEESEKAGLKLSIQKTKIMASGSITL